MLFLSSSLVQYSLVVRFRNDHWYVVVLHCVVVIKLQTPDSIKVIYSIVFLGLLLLATLNVCESWPS